MNKLGAPRVNRDDFDELSVVLVVEDNHRMPLKYADRAEAVRRMCGKLSSRQIAERLCMDHHSLRKWAANWGIVIPDISADTWITRFDPHRKEFNRRVHARRRAR